MRAVIAHRVLNQKSIGKGGTGDEDTGRKTQRRRNRNHKLSTRPDINDYRIGPEIALQQAAATVRHSLLHQIVAHLSTGDVAIATDTLTGEDCWQITNTKALRAVDTLRVTREEKAKFLERDPIGGTVLHSALLEVDHDPPVYQAIAYYLVQAHPELVDAVFGGWGVVTVPNAFFPCCLEAHFFIEMSAFVSVQKETSTTAHQ